MKKTGNQLISKKTIVFSLSMLFCSVFYAQNTSVTTTDITEKKVVESVSVDTEEKYGVESFFIINDKPVSREVYMKHLDAKREEENNSIPQQ